MVSFVQHEPPARASVVISFAVIGAAILGAVVGGGAWMAEHATRSKVAIAITAGDPSAGRGLMRNFGCAGCHTISGVPGADGKVGPRLDDLRSRVFIAGVLPNTPDNMIKWIANPERFAPHSAMPATGVSEAQARDIAAFLYSR